MIERYTIKFGPAVSQKELEKALNDSGVSPDEYALAIHKIRVRIELFAEPDDLKRINEFLKQLQRS